MPTAGSPILVADFMAQMDGNTADIGVLQSQMTSVQGRATALEQGLPQSGIRIGTTDGNGDLTITYPAAFVSTPVVVACPGGDANGVFHTIVMNNTLTTTTVNVRCRNSSDVTVTGTVLEVSWIGQA